MSSSKTKMEISNPRRILAVSLTESAQHLSDLIKDLSGIPPAAAADEGLAGTTHPLALATRYYSATVPVWLDLVASPAEWAASFLAPEAAEVLQALGGLLVVFPLLAPTAALSSSSSPSSSSAPAADSGLGSGSGPASAAKRRARELVEHVGRVVRDGLGGWEWDGVSMAVGVEVAGVGAGNIEKGVGGNGGDDDAGGGWEGGEEMDEWEDLCAQWGMEFVYLSGRSRSEGGEDAAEQRNQFGEKMGLARVREALEANDWSGGGGGVGGVEGDDGAGGNKKSKEEEEEEEKEEDDHEFDPESLEFGFDPEDFVGLRKAIWAGGLGDNGGDPKDGEEENLDDEEVQKLERMMLKLQAVRDASAGLPEEQRKRMARRAVGEVMKEL